MGKTRQREITGVCNLVFVLMLIIYEITQAKAFKKGMCNDE